MTEALKEGGHAAQENQGLCRLVLLLDRRYFLLELITNCLEVFVLLSIEMNVNQMLFIAFIDGDRKAVAIE